MPTDVPLQLLILEGDGISHEIMAVARQALDVVNQAYSLIFPLKVKPLA